VQQRAVNVTCDCHAVKSAMHHNRVLSSLTIVYLYYNIIITFSGNQFGVSDETCTELPGYDNACVMDTSAYDPETQSCKLWPPKDRPIKDYIPQVLPPVMREALENAEPFNCIR
jgi:hypothetical protein